jgi:hypothetical protein
MGTVGLFGQFGPTPSGVTSKEPLQQHREQMIQTPTVDSTECQSGTDDDDNDMEDEDGTNDDDNDMKDEGCTDDEDNDMEDEGMEDESAPDDEDYIEGQDDTCNCILTCH